MVIASIDLMKGNAVQLVGGKEKVLERENPVQLAREFDRFGEVAVIDLDAALGTGENRELIKQLCRAAECLVGGGIRTVEQAREWVSFGARKIIIGSRAFENNRVNVSFLETLGRSIGKERIIVAVDSRNREIVTHGWRKSTGLDLFETAKTLEPFVSELLFTCVEKEGKLEGTDMETVRRLREGFAKPLTVAGGVSSLEEIETLARLGVDVQLGMALYTGKIKLDEAFIGSLNWKQALLPVITVDLEGRVLMQAYVDREAMGKAFETGRMHYHSRSRRRLWRKGETSGHFQSIVRMRADCDRDAVLAVVEQTGPACHLGSYSCFGDRPFRLAELYRVIADRFENPVSGSYTASLDGVKVREKLLEEVREVVEAEGREEVVWEAADVLYFLLVLLRKESVTLEDVLWELHRRRWK